MPWLKQVPWLVGGSADLAPSTLTLQTFEGSSDFEPGNPGGRNLHFGIREHGMAAALNGMALSKIRPYGSTFFMFFDYCKPSFRLSAIGHLPAIYIFTHDSIGVGEDGPTHEPIEHLAAIRAVPRAVTIRPGDANEASEAWRTLMGINDRPVALILTRQNLPTVDRTKYAAASGVAKGAYVLADPASGPPKVILIGTGSEVSLCVAAYEQLTAQGIAARVVSMPSWELFEAQPEEYRHSVLPPAITARVAVEAAAQFGWDRYIGPTGRFVGMHSYGASAGQRVLQTFRHYDRACTGGSESGARSLNFLCGESMTRGVTIFDRRPAHGRKSIDFLTTTLSEFKRRLSCMPKIARPFALCENRKMTDDTFRIGLAYYASGPSLR